MIGPSVFSQLEALNTSLGLGLTTPGGLLKIFPNYVRMDEKIGPQPFPQLVYDCQDYEPDITMDGAAGTASLTVKILCVGTSYDEADTLAKPIATALDGTRGTWGTTTIQGCFLDEVSEDHFVDTDMETILYYQKGLSFHVAITT